MELGILQDYIIVPSSPTVHKQKDSYNQSGLSRSVSQELLMCSWGRGVGGGGGGGRGMT